MVESTLNFSKWHTYNLFDLYNAINQAKKSNKYLFVWDKQGSVATFMKYKGTLLSLDAEINKVALN